MGNSQRKLENQARWLVLERGISVTDAIAETVDAEANQRTIHNERELVGEIANSLTGFGVLQPFLDDPLVEEFWVNRPNELFVHRDGRTERIELELDRERLEVIIERMASLAGRRIDRSMPFIDARLPDGSRLHVVIPDISRDHISLNVRRFRMPEVRLSALASDTGLIKRAIEQKQTILISGATATGKSTMLCAILNELPAQARVVSVEDTFEIVTNKVDWVAMQTRAPSLEGSGDVDLRRLIRESLRMRPDWLVVGEVRGAEAVELMVALNSGIPALCTIHANSASEALDKLATLPLLGSSNLPLEFARSLIQRTVGLVIHLELSSQGERRISQILEVQN